MGIKVTLPPPLVMDPQVLQQGLDRAAGKALSAIKDGWPVDTGQSKDGWKVKPGGLLVNEEGYAAFVRGGKALDEAAGRVDQALEDFDEVLADMVMASWSK